MVQYEVEVSPEFKEEFYELEKYIQERVRKILKKLETNLCGEVLKGDLSGFYAVHFEKNHYRLIYAKEDNILKILAVHVGKRTNDFYQKFKEELKRRAKQSKGIKI
jgi:addiction module RelE/StbE family toxin